jgi:hypothetical protein
MLFLPTCKEAAALLIANEDRQISLTDKARVRLHLLACKTCPNFERQLLIMRNAMHQWRSFTGDDPPKGG